MPPFRLVHSFPNHVSRPAGRLARFLEFPIAVFHALNHREILHSFIRGIVYLLGPILGQLCGTHQNGKLSSDATTIVLFSDPRTTFLTHLREGFKWRRHHLAQDIRELFH
jgi:hypothetical protein